uniref:SLAP domain-containing protein n=1 Tax=Companilactobacillus kedongensis TaxID=2486004 RepID=UPI001784FDF6
MDFKRKRLEKALEEKTYRVKLVHGKKGWIAVGLTFVTLFGVSILGQQTADASAVNNVAVVNAQKGSSIPLWNSVTTKNIHRSNRGLQSGTAWKTDKAVVGVDGQTYVKVSTNEYANIKQMDLQDETSKQDLTGVIHVGNNTRLFSNPLDGAKPISNRALAANTDWKTDTKVTVDGVTYYRVSTDEWVKAADSNLISETSRSDKTYIANDPDAEPLPDTDTDVDNNNNGSSDNNGGGTTTPTEQNADVTIKYVDASDNTKELAPSKTVSAQKVGDTYTANGDDLTPKGSE